MSRFKHREIESIDFIGERIDFVSTNERISDRVSNISHEDTLLRTLVEVTEPDDVVWDIGACLGIHTFIAATHLPDGEVIAFEGMPINRGVLLDNRAVNKLDNVYVVPEPLSNNNDPVEFAIRQSFEAGFGRHGIATGDYENLHTFTTNAKRGDTLVATGEAPQPNVVKIDVEGAEGLVLDGLTDVLARSSCRHLFVELHAPNPVQPSYEDFGYTRHDIITMIENAGFTVDTLGEDFHLYATKDDTSASITLPSEVTVDVIHGDIAEQTADALVASAGTSLRMGTGVAGALRDAGGPDLYNESIRAGPIELGNAIATTAGDLNAEIVVHAASMPHYGDGKSTPDSIETATRNALRLADDHDCESIILPAIGCGLGGVSLTTGIERILEAIQTFTPTTLTDIRIIAYTDDERKTIERIVP